MGCSGKQEDTWMKIKDFFSNNIATPSKVLGNSMSNSSSNLHKLFCK